MVDIFQQSPNGHHDHDYDHGFRSAGDDRDHDYGYDYVHQSGNDERGHANDHDHDHVLLVPKYSESLPEYISTILVLRTYHDIGAQLVPYPDRLCPLRPLHWLWRTCRSASLSSASQNFRLKLSHRLSRIVSSSIRYLQVAFYLLVGEYVDPFVVCYLPKAYERWRKQIRPSHVNFSSKSITFTD